MRKSFKKYDVEFWNAQEEWEKSGFSTDSQAWGVMWVRVQHAVYNIIFRRLYMFWEQSDIESMSFEISSNIMQSILNKARTCKDWKVRAPVAGFCSSYCLRIYAESNKLNDEMTSLSALLGESRNNDQKAKRNEVVEEKLHYVRGGGFLGLAESLAELPIFPKVKGDDEERPKAKRGRKPKQIQEETHLYIPQYAESGE